MIERRTFFQLPGRTVALVLAGGRGSRLYELTDRRAKPAVYFGGKYRIVDFAMSNCVNSGIRRIGVLTQYKSHSLLRHIQRGWGFLRGENNEFVDLLPAQQRVDEESWYRGTADAVYQNIDILIQLLFFFRFPDLRHKNLPIHIFQIDSIILNGFCRDVRHRLNLLLA